MLALDTNVLVRYLNNDHAKLSPLALKLLQAHDCFISRVVLLEVFQVLESVYELPRSAILHALRTLFALERIEIEARAHTLRAVNWYEGGMDFADALVLSCAHSTKKLATFDRDFSNKARKLKANPEVGFYQA